MASQTSKYCQVQSLRSAISRPLRPEESKTALLPETECPRCGEAATVETLVVFRPSQGELQRQVIRCLRKAGKADRCAVTILDKAMEVVEVSSQLCECGCGNVVSEGKRFFSRACLARNAQKFRGSRVSPEEESFEKGSAVELPSIEGEQAQPVPSAETFPSKTGRSKDELEQVFEALRYLKGLPRGVRQKALELLDAVENSSEL